MSLGLQKITRRKSGAKANWQHVSDWEPCCRKKETSIFWEREVSSSNTSCARLGKDRVTGAEELGHGHIEILLSYATGCRKLWNRLWDNLCARRLILHTFWKFSMLEHFDQFGKEALHWQIPEHRSATLDSCCSERDGRVWIGNAGVPVAICAAVVRAKT